MTSSYELRDLDHSTVGQLYEGKLIIDKTYGHASYGCGTCCGDGVPTLLPNPFGGPPGINNTDVMQSLEQCTGDLIDLADDAYNWNSTNTAIATLPTKVLHTVAVGSATGSGTVYVQADHPAPRCPMAYYTPQQPVQVKPGIISIIPSTGQAGGTSAVSISGSGFGTSPTVNISPTGIEVSRVAVSQGGTVINAAFTIPSGATVGAYSVTHKRAEHGWRRITDQQPCYFHRDRLREHHELPEKELEPDTHDRRTRVCKVVGWVNLWG